MKVAVLAAVTGQAVPSSDSHPELCQLLCNRGPTKGLTLFGALEWFSERVPTTRPGGVRVITHNVS